MKSSIADKICQLIIPASVTHSIEEDPPHSVFDPTEFHPVLKTRLLILQPSPFCNITCDYCYLPNRNSSARMEIDTLRQSIKRLLEDGLVGETLSVIWHAGEPLALPLSFYEAAFEEVRKILGKDCKVLHSIQTNGTLITTAWCKFFQKHKVRIGVSVDGPSNMHDKHRHTRLGKPTHHLALRGMDLLRTYGIPFHAIAVITDATLSQPYAFFDFFLKQNVEDVSCNFDEIEGTHVVSTLTGKEATYGAFISQLLDLSIANNGRVRIRELVNAYQLIADGLPTYHWRKEKGPVNAQVIPFALITVAWNGDFSTFSPELLGQSSIEFENFVLGNVNRNSYLAGAQSKQFVKMWSAIVEWVKACRQSCALFSYCGGGAPANKLYESGTFAATETLYCRTMVKHPFQTVLTRFEEDHHLPKATINLGVSQNDSAGSAL